MSNKAKVFLIVIAGLILVAVGVFASILLVQRYQAAQTPVNAEEETVKTTVVVLTRDLSLGDRIEMAMSSWRVCCGIAPAMCFHTWMPQWQDGQTDMIRRDGAPP